MIGWDPGENVLDAFKRYYPEQFGQMTEDESHPTTAAMGTDDQDEPPFVTHTVVTIPPDKNGTTYRGSIDVFRPHGKTPKILSKQQFQEKCASALLESQAQSIKEAGKVLKEGVETLSDAKVQHNKYMSKFLTELNNTANTLQGVDISYNDKKSAISCIKVAKEDFLIDLKRYHFNDRTVNTTNRKDAFYKLLYGNKAITSYYGNHLEIPSSVEHQHKNTITEMSNALESLIYKMEQWEDNEKHLPS